MKINYLQAAFLYLILFNFGEAGDEKYDELEDYTRELLRENNYPPDAIFDNDGEPMIDWESWGAPKDFDSDQWLFNPDGDLVSETLFREPYQKLIVLIFDNPTTGNLIQALNQIPQPE